MLTKGQIARLRSLQEKKNREAESVFVVEGEKVVRELLTARFSPLELFATESVPNWGSNDPVAQIISPEEMARISHFPTPSTMLAVFALQRRVLDIASLRMGRTLALDGVQDAGNVGTLLRIADWFAFDRVLLSPDCADLFSQKVINASMGSFARVAVHTLTLAPALLQSGIPVLGCDLSGEDIQHVSPPPNVIVVIGSEGRGISPEVRASITQFVTIPRFGQAESLNAAVAAGIICDRLRSAARPT